MTVPLAPHAGRRRSEQHKLCTSPLKLPWTRPASAWTTHGYYFYRFRRRMKMVCYRSLLAAQSDGGQTEQGRPGRGRPFTAIPLFNLLQISGSIRSEILLGLFRFFANLLAGALASQRRLYAFLFAGLQVKGVALYLFNNVFLLHFALETAQSVFEGLTLLQSNFRQTDTPPNPSGRTVLLLQGFAGKSIGECEKSCMRRAPLNPTSRKRNAMWAPVRSAWSSSKSSC